MPRKRSILLAMAGLAASILLPSSPVALAAGPPHVMIVVMENHSYQQIVGNGNMPFVTGLIAANASMSTTDLSHPSLPNYIGLMSGSIYNNPQDTTPQDGTYAGPQFTDELTAAGIGWKAYMEDMPSPCDLSDQFGPGKYDVNHNPFMYFDSVRNTPSQCNRDVPYTQLTSDLNAGSAPPFIWVSPNLTHDMHDGTDQQGDAFLQGLVTQVRASSWWTANSRIIITWDEGESTEQVLTLVVGSAHGTAVNGGSHYGTLRGLEEAYGVGLLGASAATNFGDILPLLTGASTPPPPPPPPASPKPTPPASPSPSPSPTPSPTPSPVTSFPSASPGSYIRGVYGNDSSPSGLDAIAATGFNVVMANPYKQDLDPIAARGGKAIVWLGAWFSSPRCSFEYGDTEITNLVSAIKGSPTILAYYLADEPRVSECPNAPALFKQRSALVHSLDRGSKTFTVIQAYENQTTHRYAPWVGTVDILGFDVYPCSRVHPTCTFTDIDAAVSVIDGLHISNYWAILQDFQDCYYRLPTPQEVGTQFDHWSTSHMSGYLIFSWNYQPKDNQCAGTSLERFPANVAMLKYENSRTFTPAKAPAGAALSRGSLPSWIGHAAEAVALAVPLAVLLFVVVEILTERLRRRRGTPPSSGG